MSLERLDADTFRLSTGRTFYAHSGIIGLAPPDEDGWTVAEGYDGHVWSTPQWTAAERAELADAMIARWTRFKEEA